MNNNLLFRKIPDNEVLDFIEWGTKPENYTPGDIVHSIHHPLVRLGMELMNVEQVQGERYLVLSVETVKEALAAMWFNFSPYLDHSHPDEEEIGDKNWIRELIAAYKAICKELPTPLLDEEEILEL